MEDEGGGRGDGAVLLVQLSVGRNSTSGTDCCASHPLAQPDSIQTRSRHRECWCCNLDDICAGVVLTAGLSFHLDVGSFATAGVKDVYWCDKDIGKAHTILLAREIAAEVAEI